MTRLVLSGAQSFDRMGFEKSRFLHVEAGLSDAPQNPKAQRFTQHERYNLLTIMVIYY